MDVRLLIHLDRLDDEQRAVWWAESPDVPGFSAVGDTLRELRSCSISALEEICAAPIVVREQLIAVEEPGDAVPRVDTESPVQVVVPA
jgi:predicted RNase H-like HicB family nuclease